MLSILSQSTLSSLFEFIHTSTNKLLFIEYTPESMMRARWYLITVNLDFTAHLDLKPEQSGMYLINILTRHTNDKEQKRRSYVVARLTHIFHGR